MATVNRSFRSFLFLKVKLEQLLYVMDMLDGQVSTELAISPLSVVSFYELYIWPSNKKLVMLRIYTMLPYL